METTEFKKARNDAEIYFIVFYIIYMGILIFQQHYNELIVVAIAGIIIIGYLLLFRPYKYSISRKELVIHKRLGKNKEIQILKCETICDPVPKMTKIITQARALELYTEGNKRIVIVPSNRVDFVGAIHMANKRIHIQVKDYAANRKVFEKKIRKAEKKEFKQGSAN